MHCHHGIWTYQGKTYATLREALLTAWPYRIKRKEENS